MYGRSLLITLGLFASVAQALPLNVWRKLVVKVESEPCQSRSPRFEGSGLVYWTGHEYRILTSEHVLISQGDQELCATISNPELGRLKATISRFGYLNGLAELQCEIPAPLALPRYTLQPGSVSVGPVTLLGIAAGATDLSLRPQGQSEGVESRRALIPRIGPLLVVKGLAPEPGDSGGILLSNVGNDDYALDGMATHQYLHRQAGHITQIQELNAKVEANDLLFAIPLDEISGWLNSPVETDWQRRLKQGEVYTAYGPVLFRAVSAPSKYLEMAMVDPDGNGVGGGPAPLAGPHAIEISLDLQAGSGAPPQLNPKLDQWWSWLRAGEQLQIVGLYKQNEFISVYSVDQFLTYWIRDNYSPVVVRGNLKELDPQMDKLLKSTQRIRELAQGIHDDDPKVSQVLSRIVLKTHLLDNMILSNDIFNHVTEDPSFVFLYRNHFQEAVLLEAEISKLLGKLN